MEKRGSVIPSQHFMPLEFPVKQIKIYFWHIQLIFGDLSFCGITDGCIADIYLLFFLLFKSKRSSKCRGQSCFVSLVCSCFQSLLWPSSLEAELTSIISIESPSILEQHSKCAASTRVCMDKITHAHTYAASTSIISPKLSCVSLLTRWTCCLNEPHHQLFSPLVFASYKSMTKLMNKPHQPFLLSPFQSFAWNLLFFLEVAVQRNVNVKHVGYSNAPSTAEQCGLLQ